MSLSTSSYVIIDVKQYVIIDVKQYVIIDVKQYVIIDVKQYVIIDVKQCALSTSNKHVFVKQHTPKYDLCLIPNSSSKFGYIKDNITSTVTSKSHSL